MAWAAAAVSRSLTQTGSARSVRVESVVGLREGTGLWLVRFEGNAVVSSAVLRVGQADDKEQRGGFETEVRALGIAADYGILAPRLIAVDLQGSTSGEMAILSTVIDGASKIPVAPDPGRLRALGAAAAASHQVPGAERPGLVLRRRPIEPIDFEALRRSVTVRGVVAETERVIGALAAPKSHPEFVHGDLWQGNTVWVGSRFSGFVDWDCAGFGESGVDLGSLRCDVAVMYGMQFVGEILECWRDVSGRDASDVASWDAVAALSTPPLMTEFIAPIHDQGRIDLNQRTLLERRDAFLRAALDQLT